MEIQRPGNLRMPNTPQPVPGSPNLDLRTSQWRNPRSRGIVCTRFTHDSGKMMSAPSFWATSSGITLHAPLAWVFFECQPETDRDGVREMKRSNTDRGDPTPAVIRAQCAFLHQPSPWRRATGFCLHGETKPEIVMAFGIYGNAPRSPARSARPRLDLPLFAEALAL